ncbi:MAG TPA: membrane protein insertion efficiency factor YidD [Prolixibacteraceae bacterium]
MLKKVVRWIRWCLIRILMLPVYFYKYAISPMTPASCRHIPSCSEYAIDALKTHGPVKGIYLATRRILKCHPWGTHGYDPVPPRKINSNNK